MGARLIGLLLKELIQFFRDRVMLVVVLYFYTACIVMCAYALTFDVRNVALGTVDLDRTAASRELIDRLVVTDAFTPAGNPSSAKAAASWLQEGRINVALVIPNDFQRQLERGDVTRLQILLDGTNSNTAAQARGYILDIISQFEAAWHKDATPAQPVRSVMRIWYNSDLSYSTFIVLSMITIAALIVGVMYPAASIVREKEMGTIEQLLVTPIGIGELFIAKTVPTMVMGLLSVFPSLLIVWWFGVPLRGSLLVFLILTAVFLMSAISIGVVIAAVTSTLQQALLLSFFGLFPMMFLSGTVVPIESMPDFLQALSLASPLRHYMDVILGVFLKGSGFRDLWGQTAALLAIGVPLFALAGLIFRRTTR